MTLQGDGLSPVFDEESAAWVDGLRNPSSREATAARLHAVLVRVARAECARRSASLRLSGPEHDDLAHQAAADALLAIVGKVDEFRGESRFTTWAYKFVIFEVAKKVARHTWRRPAVVLEDEAWDRLPARFGIDPHEQVEYGELFAALRDAVRTELTEHQRAVFTALVLDGEPVDALAAELGSNRNAIYKTMFDARRKLRLALGAKGHLPTQKSGT